MQANVHSCRHIKHLLHSFSSFRFRLMLWYLLILGTVLGSFSAAIYFTEEHALYEGLNTTLNTTIEQLATFYDQEQGSLVKSNPDVLVILQNPQGRITQIMNAPSGPPDLSPGSLPPRLDLSAVKTQGNSQLSFTLRSANGQTLRFTASGALVIAQIVVGWSLYAMKRVNIANQQGQLLSIMYVGIPSNILEQLGQLLAILAGATPLVLLFSSVGGYWLAARAIRPVQTITRAAQEISETDLHRRLNLRRRDEMGELAMTFDGMLERLERAFERQQQFTADASHELRTPLSIINTEVERVLQRPHPIQAYVQVLEIIQQENQRMTRLVSGLLVLARADKGQAIVKRERVDLVEVVIDGAEHVAYLAKQNGVEIHLSGLDELFVWGDQLYLTQLCTNLLENAIKYSVGVGKHVEVKLDRVPNQARIQIIDEGLGIEASHLPHIFERFYRVDQSRTHSCSASNTSNIMGSGLGLSISHWIVQQHGGYIQVQSKLGQGSVFEVCIPL